MSVKLRKVGSSHVLTVPKNLKYQKIPNSMFFMAAMEVSFIRLNGTIHSKEIGITKISNKKVNLKA